MRRHLSPLVPIPTLLRRARRSPRLYWAGAAILTALAVSNLATRTADLERRERALGERATVAVSLGTHRAGDLLGPDDVELRSVPRSLVPERAIHEVTEPKRLASDIEAGEVLLPARLRGGSQSPLAAALANGEVAIAVALPPAHLELRPGDRVELVALGPDGASDTVAAEARVLGATADTASVAVPRRDAVAATDASLAGTLSIWLLSG